MEGRGGDAAAPLDYTAGDKQMLNAQMIESVTPESPIAHARPSFEVNNDTPKKKKQCNCKHSRCLKLYCECFASGTYCDGCNCNNCYNNPKNDAARKEAVEATLERNLNAFRPKIANSPHGKRDIKEEVGDGVVLAKHNKGCHCKKSGCLKKYCECFQANILCSDNCKCTDCKNYDRSHERQALFHGDHANNIAQMQVSANAAVTGAVGSYGFGSPPSAKKRKGQEPLGPASKQFHWLSQVQEVNRIRSPSFASMSSVPVPISGSPAVAYDQSKLNYRSLLADLIQPQDLTALCSVLVAMTTEAATTFADKTNTSETPVTNDPGEPNLAATTQAQRAPPDDKSNGIQAARELRVEDCASDGTGLPNVRPLPPGTLALMCDEQDTSLMAVASSLHQKLCRTPQLSDGVGMPDLYIEQERIVLAKLRDCLNRLISFGEIKETQCLSFARNVSDSQRNGTCADGGNAKVPLHPSTRMSYPIATLSSVTPSVANHHSRGSLAEKKRGHAA